MRHNSFPRVSVEAHAKINWALELLRKRDDGYHEIATLLEGVDLSDQILLEETEGGIALETSDPSVPSGPENLAWQAARLVQEAREISRGVRIVIEKKLNQFHVISYDTAMERRLSLMILRINIQV